MEPDNDMKLFWFKQLCSQMGIDWHDVIEEYEAQEAWWQACMDELEQENNENPLD